MKPFSFPKFEMYSVIKKMKFTRFFILFLITLLFSCSKQDEAQPNSESIPITYRADYEDDRIYFQDFEEFEDYYLELDSIMKYNDAAFDSIVLGITPVTTVLKSLVNQVGFQTFLSDPVMRAILNLNYEFQIGEVMVTYINNSEILASDVSSSTTRSSIRSITKGQPLDFDNIPAGAFVSTPEDIAEGIKIFCGSRIYIGPFDCTTLRVFGSCNGFFGSDGGGRVVVSFHPDGTTNIADIDTLLHEVISGNFEFFIDVTPLNFANVAGLIRATLHPHCFGASDKRDLYSFEPNSLGSCDEAERFAEQVFTNGSERMWVRTSFYRNFWGDQHKAEMRSETNNGTNWVKSRADLRVEVDANRKGIYCNFIDAKDDNRSCSDCFSKYVGVLWTSRTAHCDGDLVGSFRKIKSGVTLIETQSVDFECCE